MSVWRLIAHHEDVKAAVDWFLGSKKIALGWGWIGDLSQFDSAIAICARIQQVYPQLNDAGHGGQSSLRFRDQMKIDDRVIISGRGRRRVVMRVTGSIRTFCGSSAARVKLPAKTSDGRCAGSSNPGLPVTRRLTVLCQADCAGVA